MESKASEQDNEYKILVQDKKGCYALYPFKSKKNKIFNIDQCNSIKTNKDFISIISSGKLSLYSTKDFTLIKSFDLEQVVSHDISPKGNFITIIQKPAIEKNLKVISLKDFNIIYSFHSAIHPSTKWPQIYYSENEDIIFKHIKGVIEIYTKTQNNEIIKISSIENIVEFVNYEYINNNGDKDIYIAGGRVEIDSKKNTKKSFFSIYNIKDLNKPYKDMPTSFIDSMKLKISPDNQYILVNSINENTSNVSYYGNSTLYFSELKTGKFSKFVLPEGPIHDFSWTPNGEFFIICAGHLPSKTILYKKNNSYVKDIVLGKFNRIYISPDSRLVALGGFGSLNGDIEFYRLDNCQLIGRANIFCCVNLFWSFDSKYLLGSILAPRVMVDNEYKILTYNGEVVVEDKDKGELYNCIWIYNGNEGNDFEININTKSLEKKKKTGVILTSTLGTINFSRSNKPAYEEEEVPGLGKKKRKKKK